MTGKTHMAFGIAAGFVVDLPKTPTEIIICFSAAAIGGVISDIDVSTSDARRNFNKLLKITALILLIASFLEYHFELGMISFARQYGYVLTAAGFLLFLAVCIYGKQQPHRSFMHSILAITLLTGSVYMIFPLAAFPFGAAMTSHIMLDLLNKKRIKLFYPFRKGVALYLCRADGVVNTILLYLSIFIDVVMIVWILFHYVTS